MLYLDPAVKVPLYIQMKTYILGRIRSGEWIPGHLLPTESEFQELLGVSRMTVRHALDDLENEGYIIKKQGKGTYVAPEKLSYHLPKLTSFSEDMQQKGFVPGSQTLQLDIIQNAAVAAKMQLAEDAHLLYMHRMRTLNGHPLGIHDAYFNLELLDKPKMLDEIQSGRLAHALDAESASFYSILENHYGIVIHYADEFLEAVGCPQRFARMLGVKANTPILMLERTTYTQDNQIIEFVRMYNRADQYKYSIRLTR